ncbi:MAG: hypothetical protein RBR71_12725 [Gudongella sp.]|nr:hypothetical protein [Gudongella sp.]
MFKYTKYEFLGTYKFLMGAIGLIIVASTAIQMFFKNQYNFANGSPGSIEAFQIMPFVMLAATFTFIGAFIAVAVYLISSFRKELYEDRGYLTFALPMTGSQLLGSKLIIALFWSVVMGIVVLVYNMVLARFVFGPEWYNLMLDVIKQAEGLGKIIVSYSLISVIETVVTLLLVYFTITISRVSIKSKKIGGFWFVLFLILSSFFSYIQSSIADSVPLYLDITKMEFLSQNRLYFDNMNPESMMNLANAGVISISGLGFQIILTVGLFLGTAYMLEKKIDLV